MAPWLLESSMRHLLLGAPHRARLWVFGCCGGMFGIGGDRAQPLCELLASVKESLALILPQKSHGQRSLVGCSPWGCKESDTTKQLSTHGHTHTHTHSIKKYCHCRFLQEMQSWWVMNPRIERKSKLTLPKESSIRNLPS